MLETSLCEERSQTWLILIHYFCTLLNVESFQTMNSEYFTEHSRLWVFWSVSRWSVCAGFLFLFHPGTVLAVHHGRLISWPLLAWDLCSNCGSKPRHGGHWYIPWESTGYPKVIIAASWIFVFFCSLDDFPGYLFSVEDNVCNHFYIFVFHHQPEYC